MQFVSGSPHSMFCVTMLLLLLLLQSTVPSVV
jgi:hypothetical protein